MTWLVLIGGAALWFWVHPVAGAAFVVAAYALACWWFPYAACWCCHGSGKHRSSSGKTFRRCLVCGGRGSWWRLGRRAARWLGSAE
ncbi:hypothetical protein Psed_5779 [Pseudonocardia dioxanivorans CB1190]|uniref:Uncharacterized protein n=1 Tax=Pseudonocardia dioxanivorans (strain ATCC 55486 / DSM 44775 / JCM 13855 / CB1190) TaxID=675635 RepID=F4D1B8_PSEUX|nr:hypothetical protein [Pseudonocardia dioxanivorans]AEA27906.1 hypothetical protein Psed_5779 [Pseudonocardia dioxanivorans CB1190]